MRQTPRQRSPEGEQGPGPAAAPSEARGSRARAEPAGLQEQQRVTTALFSTYPQAEAQKLPHVQASQHREMRCSKGLGQAAAGAMACTDSLKDKTHPSALLEHLCASDSHQTRLPAAAGTKRTRVAPEIFQCEIKKNTLHSDGR